MIVWKIVKLFEPRHEKTLGFLTRSKHKLAVQPQKMARGLKLWLQEVEGFALSIYIYIVHENKGADQVRGNRTADLHLLFSHIEKKIMFSHDTSQILAVVREFSFTRHC